MAPAKHKAEANYKLMVGVKELERYLLSQGVNYSVTNDIEFVNDITRLLATRKIKEDQDKGWPVGRKVIAVQQLMFLDAGANPGEIDGLIGPMTLNALEVWQNIIRDTEPTKAVVKVTPISSWPRERGVAKFYGPVGTGLTNMDLPYPMRIAWDPLVEVNRIAIHSKCAESAFRVLERILLHYGKKEIDRLGMNLFGGCLANPPRFKRGSTKSPSMHNWGIAIDFDPVQNQLRWGRDRARLAKPASVKFWEFWEEEGWVSLGRERNYDWMHVQAANF